MALNKSKKTKKPKRKPIKKTAKKIASKTTRNKIPDYLKQYTAKQRYNLYTAIDQASWRYIMRVSRQFFKDHAHDKYLSGLSQTGIATDYIPHIEEIDAKLKKFGWQAAVVTGFIPPAVFLEFLSLSILPIACDMRRLEHLEYTPAPDIVHEAAGHAPIISDKKFASYLRKFGEIARKAIFSKEDLEVYEAVRELSELKEDPVSSQPHIDQAYEKLNQAIAAVRYVSEASKLSRLGWWSTEYGLVKSNGDYKIYGAGLLSSVGESYNAFVKNVPRQKLTIDCVNVNFDITKPQPQLFYVDSFTELADVIDELADTMAYKKGGLEGLKIAETAGTVTTAVFDTGLQVSGVLAQTIEKQNAPIYLKYTGPCQLSANDKELKGHGANYHKQGFGTPVGKIKNSKKSAAHLTNQELKKMGFSGKKPGRLEFESGVVVTGVLKKQLRAKNKNLILSFTKCMVTYNGQTLFEPEWGTFDMACGEKVVSVFGGAADRAQYLRLTGGYGARVKPQSSNLTAENSGLVPLYKQVRSLRERGVKVSDLLTLQEIFTELENTHKDDWLLRLELAEVLGTAVFHGSPEANSLKTRVLNSLEHLKGHSEVLATLIDRGHELLVSPAV